LIAEIDWINDVLYATNKQEALSNIDLLTIGGEPFQARHSYCPFITT
jgi:hypothetical protein